MFVLVSKPAPEKRSRYSSQTDLIILAKTVTPLEDLFNRVEPEERDFTPPNVQFLIPRTVEEAQTEVKRAERFYEDVAFTDGSRDDKSPSFAVVIPRGCDIVVRKEHKTTWEEEPEDQWSETHPRRLIPELCRLFYNLGWVTGTGGGISIKHNEAIYIAPSGVQKERIQPDDMFVQNMAGVDLKVPAKQLKKSQCTPLFMCAYQERAAGAVIHTHSKHAVLVTLLCQKEFRISHQEMIKGMWNYKLGRYYQYNEELVIPIIENTCWESELEDSLRQAVRSYPEAAAVLVRRHGVYVWGASWEKAKTMCECLDYLLELAVDMKRFEIPWTKTEGTKP
nr:EOG090X0D1G [Eulimnadia texana]